MKNYIAFIVILFFASSGSLYAQDSLKLIPLKTNSIDIEIYPHYKIYNADEEKEKLKNDSLMQADFILRKKDEEIKIKTFDRKFDSCQKIADKLNELYDGMSYYYIVTVDNDKPDIGGGWEVAIDGPIVYDETKIRIIKVDKPKGQTYHTYYRDELWDGF